MLLLIKQNLKSPKIALFSLLPLLNFLIQCEQHHICEILGPLARILPENPDSRARQEPRGLREVLKAAGLGQRECQG